MLSVADDSAPLWVDQEFLRDVQYAGPARNPRIPGLIGLSAAAAVATARRHHLGVTFDGAAIDRADQFGTVIFQSLPPGARGGDRRLAWSLTGCGGFR